MSGDTSKALAVVQAQIKELDALAKQTLVDLNTMAGAERVARWKAKTAGLLSEAVGQTEAQRFAALQPGPSFTNDLVEEFTDLIETYRTPLMTLAKQLSQAPRAGS
ncbi:MAG: hypothetical protein ICV75_05285 [Nitrospiraceae bacterium]|nr:hypothetical protein [Nitrospiraceae bacterium]